MSNPYIHSLVKEAAELVGTTWPLYSFVTSNPLSGYEHQPFTKAAEEAKQLLGARVYPEAKQFADAFKTGAIDENILKDLLKEHGFEDTPENYLKLLSASPENRVENPFHDLDRLTAKWVGAFMDEGLAEWSMPFKNKGFYHAWSKVAPYDAELKASRKSPIPATAAEAIARVLEPYSEAERKTIVTRHLTTLPGWTGYIKFRMQNPGAWQEQYPIDLEQYLGARLWMAKMLDTPVMPESVAIETDTTIPELQHLFLSAWEQTWQETTLAKLQNHRRSKAKATPAGTPDAQMVFCIDTRSEPIRRHIEATGNYETFGYAGFFGIAMDYINPVTGESRKSCPPILPSAYEVTERPREGEAEAYEDFQKKTASRQFIKYFLKRMKNMLPSTFGFVEGSGLVYGVRLLSRTIFPANYYRSKENKQFRHEHICNPELQGAGHEEAVIREIPLEEKTRIVKGAFDLMGWKTFAPLVVFTGHGSHTANNPFGSSLDCGACAASPGRHNARMLALLANQKEVRQGLLMEHGIVIPDFTWFLGAEHNTTTDHITLFDMEVPDSHLGILDQLKADLNIARKNATRDRLEVSGDGIAEAEARAGSWAETRPEWGLAKNAGFIIAPRKSTKDLDLDGRCFLHSYQWQHDKEGKALEGIMQGPMVVTQWINNHYYFSSVDMEAFGSGSKITHNVTGMFGVVQGNGGDLKKGLPLQSLRATDQELYHQPLRLSVIIEAPCKRVTEILERNAHLQTLLDNKWIHLVVTDPEAKYQSYHYTGNLQWQPQPEETQVVTKISDAVMAE